MRKISANYIYSPNNGLLKNAILTLDENGRVYELRENKSPNIEEEGTEFYNGIICPGFINAHCHIELSHLKNRIPEGEGLDKFIYSIVTGRRSEQAEIEKAIAKADEEMKREGIVAVGDISNKIDSFHVKSQSTIFYHTYIEIFNMQNRMAEETFSKGVNLLNTARNEYKLRASLTPHAPYSVSEKLFTLFRNNLNTIDNPISIHSQESEFENDFIKTGKGRFYELFTKLGMETGDSLPREMNSLKYISQYLPKTPSLLLVHNVYTKQTDIDESYLESDNTWFCLCPNSNFYISKEKPGTFLIENYPDNICLGTDSLASNHRLSILEEMKALQLEHKELALSSLIQFATINGAKALNLGSHFGSFEKGKKPGVVLIERADLQNLKLTKESKVRVLI
ncbi:MAG: amidohydrolase family protein [Bacteroidales bacterium]|nr:amidohydrolase family protein [Bacteroidales bacterium]MCF8389599.1 amidohydrolase family protein [Bacteroidales bacterium]